MRSNAVDTDAPGGGELDVSVFLRVLIYPLQV